MALRRLQPNFKQALLTGASYWELAEPEIAAICEGPRKAVGHACEVETSMVMHLRPGLVRAESIKDDVEAVPDALRGSFIAKDMGQRTVHGAVGYPEQASAGKGKTTARCDYGPSLRGRLGPAKRTTAEVT